MPPSRSPKPPSPADVERNAATPERIAALEAAEAATAAG